MTGIDPGVGEDHRGAVRRQRVVEARSLTERVDVADVIQEDPPKVLVTASHRKEVHVFGRILPVIRPHPDEVALVSHDVDQLVLAEEALDRGISLGALLARLHRDGQTVLPEAEGQKQMRNGGAHPVGSDEIEAVQLTQVESAIVVRRREIRLGAVVEVPYVSHGDSVAVEDGIGQHGDFRLPITNVGGLCGDPDSDDERERARKAECDQSSKATGRLSGRRDDPDHGEESGHCRAHALGAGSEKEEDERTPAGGPRDREDGGQANHDGQPVSHAGLT